MVTHSQSPFLGATPRRELVSPRYFPQRIVEIALGDDAGVAIINREEIDEGSFGVPGLVKDELTSVSQLGLKEGWIGALDKAAGLEHDRWNHSVGTFNAGLIWLRSLQQGDRVPKHCLLWPKYDWEHTIIIAGAALVLHDYGHLPFAHLFDEVLNTINWLPAAEPKGSEFAVLRERLGDSRMRVGWQFIAEIFKDEPSFDTGAARDIVEALITGDFGVPWLQTMVNSPLDADKIDYLRFDGEFITESGYPLRTRLYGATPHQWFGEFISDQQVNHAGLLMLNGRSARTTAELWQERYYLYDRFYLSPELRVPERMALEIVRQFVIQSTMSEAFLRTQSDNLIPLAERLSSYGSANRVDSIVAKFHAVLDLMRELIPDHSSTGRREFPLLKEMSKGVQATVRIDEKYRQFLGLCFDLLQDLIIGDPNELGKLVKESLVNEPLILAREEFASAREVLRPLDHAYAHEALIDVVRSPRVLSGPRRSKHGLSRRSVGDFGKYSVLVPDGPASSWAPGQKASVPLTDDCVSHIEKGFTRILVVCPGGARTARAAYIWDRVRATLMEAGLNPKTTRSSA